MKRRTAIVTGAAGGIGNAIAKYLIADGCFVIHTDITESGNADNDNTEPDMQCYFQCDITKEEQVNALFDFAKSRYETIDVLVNSAGVLRDNVIWKMTADDFDFVMDVNLRGTWLTCREAAKVMKDQKSGRIVNIASRAWLGNPGQSNYSASKAGVVGLTRVLALELGKYGVLVNAVAPGLIDTPLTRNLPDEVLQKLIHSQPTKSMGHVDDVARMVAFLCHPETQFITGQTINVDGGKSIGGGI